MKQAIESPKAWQLLLAFWNNRDNVLPEERCPVKIEFPDERDDEQCVLHKSHSDGEAFQANIPHADKDGNIVALRISWQTLAQARYFEEHPR